MTNYFDQRRQLIDDRLRKLAAATGAPAPLEPALQAALSSSGKRVRGILTLAVGEAVGAKRGADSGDIRGIEG